MTNIELLRWLVLYLLKSANDHKGTHVQFTFPGTNWCGPGNSSRNVHDLGYFTKTDECCREHDHCPLYISGNQKKYGLVNDVPYTRSECNCDTSFYNCLQNVQSTMDDMLISTLMGNIYFTFLEDRCFEVKPPYIICERDQNSENCITLSSSQTTSYEWRTMPPFHEWNFDY